MYKKRAVRAKFLFCQSNLLLRPRYRFLGSSLFRARLHGSGAPQVGEITRLGGGGVKKITLLYMQSDNPAILGCNFLPFFDYCYFYWDTRGEPLRRRERLLNGR